MQQENTNYFKKLINGYDIIELKSINAKKKTTEKEKKRKILGNENETEMTPILRNEHE